jgi:hypothetical protein
LRSAGFFYDGAVGTPAMQLDVDLATGGKTSLRTALTAANRRTPEGNRVQTKALRLQK